MCGVNINLKQKRIEATNAHVLVMYPIEIIESDIDNNIDSLIVPIRFFNVSKYMIDIPKKYQDSLEYIFTDEFAEVYFRNELVYRCRYVDAKFPNIQAVLPTDKWKRENDNKIGFNINVLEKLTKYPPTNPNSSQLLGNVFLPSSGNVVKANSFNSASFPLNQRSAVASVIFIFLVSIGL